MEKALNALTAEERGLLIKAPALMSLMAASSDGEITEKEKAEAIELAHMRTFTSPPELRPYYREVEEVFKPELEQYIEKYSPSDETKREAMTNELKRMYEVMDKLNNEYEQKLKDSLKSYADHVGNLHHNFLEYFAFPLNIKGINE